MVTAETALAMPALVVVLAGLVAVIVAITAQLRCVAAAREGARAAARGEPHGKVVEVARSAAPDAASVQTTGSADTVTVTVSAPLRVFNVRLGSVTVTASATAQREPERADDGAASAAALFMVGFAVRRLKRSPSRSTRSPPDGERGSGTIYAAAAIGVLAAIVAAAALIGRAHVANARAESAADLAALAAAQTLLDASGDPCARAAQVAAQNSATIAECVIDGETVLITATVPVRLGPLGLLSARGKARAGPIPDDRGS